MNFPVLNGDDPRSTSSDVYIFNLFFLLECPIMSMTYILLIKFRPQNISDKDIDIINFVRRFHYQCCYFCESSCLFYLRFNFGFLCFHANALMI